jgi:hypothetical protein
VAASDLLILYAGEKETAARRLEEALAAAGYRASLTRIGSSADEAQSIGTAGATIVVWSKAVMAAEPVVAALDSARQSGRLIEASGDGIAPIPALDDNRVALLSGWRGEPHHPGWQRILSELGKTGAVRAPAPRRTAAPPVAAGAPRVPRRAATAAVVGALLLLVMGVAAAAWIGGGGSPPDQREAIANVMAAPAAPLPQPAPAPVEVAVANQPPLATAAAATAAPELEPAPPRASVRTQPAAPRIVEAPTPKREPASRSRNARNMRLFCEGSGRSTPQCRSFRRAAGTASAEAAPSVRSKAEAPVRYRNSRNMRRFCDGAGRHTSQCRLFLSRTAQR